MDPDAFIDEALTSGERFGLDALDRLKKVVFAVSEAETSCDVDGIDSLIDRYSPDALSTFMRAFSLIGANEIADSLAALSSAPYSEELRARANALITSRTGYDYDSIRAYVAAELQHEDP